MVSGDRGRVRDPNELRRQTTVSLAHHPLARITRVSYGKHPVFVAGQSWQAARQTFRYYN